MGRIVIAGGGVAGSYLAYKLASMGFDVTLYDRVSSYGKACGDALTLRPGIERIVEETNSLRAEVKSYTVYVNGVRVADVEFPSRNWVIIDKSKFVNGLRKMAEAERTTIITGEWSGELGDLTVDARGPYAWKLRYSVMVYRIIARAKWDPDYAVLDFRVGERGFYWVFPADSEGRTVNIGGGFEAHKKLSSVKRQVMEYSAKMLGGFEVVDERGAPVTVKSPILLRSGNVFRVGEAAGLVISTAGEGNRPALISAEALAEAVSAVGLEDLDMIEKRYKSGIRSLLSEVSASRRLLSIVESAGGDRGAWLMSSLPREFWRRYFESRVTLGYVASLALKRPGLGLRLARVLLSSRSAP